MNTIKSTREIDAIFRKSDRVTHHLVTILVAPTPIGRGPKGRVAFIAGKRIGGAVQRNRAKRIMREAMRRTGGTLPGRDVLLIARDGARNASADEMTSALDALRRRLTRNR